VAERTLLAADRLAIQEEALRFGRVGLCRCRPDGTIVEINQAAFEILDLAPHFAGPDQASGRRIRDLVADPGSCPEPAVLLRQTAEERATPCAFRTLSGRDKWVVCEAFLVGDPATGEEQVQVMIRDVTETHEREAALRESEERLARIVETIADGILILDREGRFTFANAAAERILGLQRRAITARSILDPAWKLTTADGRPIAAQELPFERVLARNGPVYDVRFAIERPDGSRVILSVNGAPLRAADGSLAGVVLSVTDITERVRLERLRDEFLSTAAHELKTPVATIKGYAQLLQQWAAGGHDTREAMALSVINRQSDRLNRLVQQLLEFSRLQHERFVLHRQRFDLGDLAAEVVARMQPTAPRHRLLLERSGPAPVMADRDRIDEVLFNLLDNAIKASPKGGDVETRVYTSAGEAIVSVKDYGVGIPAEKQPHIFERFYQAHAGAPYDRGGMGIGLYLSREIITRHGGRMWFQSELGRGSTFYFSLPLAEGGADGHAG
jgi:two-component system phosphate regulon sensor histidine kinase PhoR